MFMLSASWSIFNELGRRISCEYVGTCSYCINTLLFPLLWGMGGVLREGAAYLGWIGEPGGRS